MFRIDVDTKDVMTRLGDLHKQFPTVARNALNDTSFGLRGHMQELIRKTFKNPHPSTVRNVFVRKADKQNLRAIILFDQLYRKGLDEYMLAEIEGGGRSKKPSEVRFGRYWVPADKVNKGLLNKYGNVTGGKVQQILSRLGLFNTAGYNQNQTAASKAKLKGSKKSLEYFMLTSKRGGLIPGVYERVQQGTGFGAKTKKGLSAGAFQYGTRSGGVTRDKLGRITGHTSPKSSIQSIVQARGVKPVLLFTKQPQYKPIFPFFTSGQAYINKNLPNNINKEINWAIQKSWKQGGLF